MKFEEFICSVSSIRDGSRQRCESARLSIQQGNGMAASCLEMYFLNLHAGDARAAGESMRQFKSFQRIADEAEKELQKMADFLDTEGMERCRKILQS